MIHYLTKKSSLPFDKVIEKVRHSLHEEGFNVVSEIDVKNTFAKKEIKFKNYKILNIYNRDIAYRAVSLNDKMGMHFLYNIIVQEFKKNKGEVSAIDPFQAVFEADDIKLKILAYEIGEKLKKVLKNI